MNRSMTLEPAIALVDYDNIGMTLVGRGDTVVALPDIIHLTVEAVRRHMPNEKGVEVRLYGGWLDEDGWFSAPAARLLPELRHYRGLRQGIRVVPSLALSIRGAPDCRLAGTVRSAAARPRQKMVDGMLTLDISACAAERRQVLIVSDDDDLVPAALLSARKGGAVHWARLRTRPSCNDALLERESVVFRSLR